MGRKNKKGGGGKNAQPGSAANGEKSSETSMRSLSKGAKKEVFELVTQLLESMNLCTKIVIFYLN